MISTKQTDARMYASHTRIIKNPDFSAVGGDPSLPRDSSRLAASPNAGSQTQNKQMNTTNYKSSS